MYDRLSFSSNEQLNQRTRRFSCSSTSSSNSADSSRNLREFNWESASTTGSHDTVPSDADSLASKSTLIVSGEETIAAGEVRRLRHAIALHTLSCITKKIKYSATGQRDSLNSRKQQQQKKTSPVPRRALASAGQATGCNRDHRAESILSSLSTSTITTTTTSSSSSSSTTRRKPRQVIEAQRSLKAHLGDAVKRAVQSHELRAETFTDGDLERIRARARKEWTTELEPRLARVLAAYEAAAAAETTETIGERRNEGQNLAIDGPNVDLLGASGRKATKSRRPVPPKRPILNTVDEDASLDELIAASARLQGKVETKAKSQERKERKKMAMKLMMGPNGQRVKEEEA